MSILRHQKASNDLCLAESGHIIAATRTKQRDNAACSCSSVEKDAGRDEEESSQQSLMVLVVYE